MYVDRLLYPVEALGPGQRIALWVSGCSRHCPKCANPELWKRYEYQKISSQKLVAEISRVIGQSVVDGITITGGEPFDQANELCDMIDRLPKQTNVLVFTGYKYDELLKKEDSRELLSRIDVLIDGEYVDEWNDNRSALRGSVNQRIWYLNKAVQLEYEKYLAEGRKIQNFVYDYQTISVGIHNRNLQVRGAGSAGKK